MDQTELLLITFKYGGCWVQVQNQSRKRYDGGKQKSVRIQKENLNLQILKEKVDIICPWLEGLAFELLFHKYGTSPKEYIRISSDVEVLQMIAQSNECGRLEVIVISETDICSQSQQSQIECAILDGKTPRSNSSYVENIVRESSIEYPVIESGADTDLKVGTRFCDNESFKQFIRSNAIINNFGMKFKACNRSRIVVICSHRGCPWRVRATLCADGHSFEIRRLDPIHLCPGVNRAGNKQATSSWVAKEIEEVVKKNIEIPPKQINDILENSYGLSLPYMKLWRSREQAKNNIFGSVDDNYRWVPALQVELMNRNPGSHITYICDKFDSSFKRFYVSFKVSIDGFLAGCRHLIGIDACHLKSKYLGVLLCANTLDGNNGLYTLAFAVAETESKRTWQWFLEQLTHSIGLELHHLAFLSDMEKGLGEAIKIVFPNAEHRVCMRHLWKNLKKFFHCNDTHRVQQLVWSAANCYTKHEFDEKMNELGLICPQVYAYLIALPYKWSRSDFSIEIKNHYNTNNMAESFNSWVGEARNKPIVDLIDKIRAMLMEQRAERKLTSYTWKGVLVPYAEEYLRAISTRKEQFVVRQSTPHKSEVESSHERHEVDLYTRECSCRVWQLTGLPCIHAAAVIGGKEHPTWHTYVHECYYVSRYKLAYEGPISTLPAKEQWVQLTKEVYVGVPNTLRPRGRPKKRRLQNFLEKNAKKTKNVHKCGRCGLWGHHKTTCKNPLTQVSLQLSKVDNATNESDPLICSIGFRPKLPIRRNDMEQSQ